MMNNILIVDDDILVLRSVEHLLSKIDAHVHTAKNGEEALILAQSHVFDCIISDLQMPRMDGNELIKKLRHKPEYKFTPFLFLSGNTEEETWVKNLNDGADDFITKPFNPDVLLAKIKANLDKAQMRKEANKAIHQRNISFEIGKTYFCLDPNDPDTIQNENIIGKIITVENEKLLFDGLQHDNIWLVLISDNAQWIHPILPKVMDQAKKKHVPIYFLADLPLNKHIDQLICKLEYGNILPKLLGPSAIGQQINILFQREIEVKDKYLSALSSAASNTPIKFDHNLDRQIAGFKLSFFHEPFEKIPGGDFYEFFALENNKELIVLGDVMGKKWRAWFFSLAYIAYIRSTINFLISNQDYKDKLNPKYLLEVLNNYIYKDLQLSEVFTTLSIILIDPDNSKLNIASAGSLRPLYYNAKNKQIKRLNIVGTLLGVIENSNYNSFDLEMEQNDKLLLFTDGYLEAITENGSMVGEVGIENAYRKATETEDTNSNKIEQILQFDIGVKNWEDDRTMLLIQQHNK